MHIHALRFSTNGVASIYSGSKSSKKITGEFKQRLRKDSFLSKFKGKKFKKFIQMWLYISKA